jgi:hypothetical protein
VIVTTNLPFSEWTHVIPNARLCKALLDRITNRAHILETGKNRTDSAAAWKSKSREEKLPRQPHSYGNAGPWKSRKTGVIPIFPQLRRLRIYKSSEAKP